MNCKAVQTRLSAYLDRELSGEELLEMRAHLFDCNDCSQEEKELRMLKAMLGGFEAPETPPGLESRLRARVLGASREERPFWSPRSMIGAFALVAASSMLATLALLTFGQQSAGVAPAKSPNVASDVQRDQAYSTGLDATEGAPLITWADYAGR